MLLETLWRQFSAVRFHLRNLPYFHAVHSYLFYRSPNAHFLVCPYSSVSSMPMLMSLISRRCLTPSRCHLRDLLSVLYPFATCIGPLYPPSVVDRVIYYTEANFLVSCDVYCAQCIYCMFQCDHFMICFRDKLKVDCIHDLYFCSH